LEQHGDAPNEQAKGWSACFVAKSKIEASRSASSLFPSARLVFQS